LIETNSRFDNLKKIVDNIHHFSIVNEMTGKFYSFHISSPELIQFLDNLGGSIWKLADGTVVRGRNGYIKMWLELGFKHRSELWPSLFGIKTEIKEAASP